MSDDDERGARSPNRTIQIDALTDVQLIDHRAESEPPPAAPPPLPRRPRGPSSASRIALTVIAVVAGAACAFAVVHFLMPSPTPVTPPPSAVTAEPAPPPVRHITLDQELVIQPGQPTPPE